MIPAQYYQTIYIIITSIISIYCFNRRKFTNYQKDIQIENQIPSILLTIFMIIFIGTRPINGRYFLDMKSTANEWYLWDQGDVYYYQWGYTNKIYDNMRSFMSTHGMPVELFFFIIATVYFGCIYFSCRRLFPNDTLFSLLVYLAAFSTFSYATNGIKAGAASAIFLIALAFYEKWRIWLPIILVSWGFHHSMIMVVACFILVYIYCHTKNYFIFWVFAFLIAAAHITVFQKLFSGMSNDIGSGYLVLQRHGKGFRLDFIAYSAVPVIIGYYCIFIKKIKSKKYEIILNLYLLTNSIWMLCMYAEFTNRIAYLSWFLHPVVMIYPFINEKIDQHQNQIANYIAIGHLGFTLFLYFIYWR